MKTTNTSTKATPDTTRRENLWFSPLTALSSDCKHLSTGEPMYAWLYDLIRKEIGEAVLFLPPTLVYEQYEFFSFWDALSIGDRIRAGRCVADIAREKDSPIGMVRCGKKQSMTYYYIRATSPRTPLQQTPNPQNHQH